MDSGSLQEVVLISLAVIIAAGVVGAGLYNKWLKDKASGMQAKLPQVVPAKGGCSDNHDWITIKMADSSSQIHPSDIPETLVCTKCGHFGDGSKSMLNEAGLKACKESESDATLRETEAKEVGKRLQFDLSLYYDTWVATNKDQLLLLLKDSNKVEELHELLDSFLIDGSNTANALRDRIQQELRSEAKV